MHPFVEVGSLYSYVFRDVLCINLVVQMIDCSLEIRSDIFVSAHLLKVNDRHRLSYMEGI